MAYDEPSADRVRAALRGKPELTEKRMFGGLAFLHRGNMVCGVLGEDLVLRLGNDGAAAALEEPHTRPMDFTGRPIRSMVYVAAAGFADEDSLRSWLDRALEFARTLPPK